MKSPDLALRFGERFLQWQGLVLLLPIFGACAWFATGVLTARSLALAQGSQWIVGASALLAFAVGVMLVRRRHWGTAIPVFSGYKVLSLALAAGLMARLIWVLAVHAAPASDGATYVSLAINLINGKGLGMPDAHSYWPPGYPLFLAPFLRILPVAVAVPLTQIGLFVVAAIGVFKLTRLLNGERSAGFAVVLFAIWPNLITLCATPEKEMLAMTLLIWAFYLLLLNSKGPSFTSGLLFAAAALVQPGLQLLLPAALILMLIRSGRRGVLSAALFLIGAVIVIGPITARNYAIFGTFKLISTNGGDNFYRANNSIATGGYTVRGEIDLGSLPELEKDRLGSLYAKEWIRDHPGPFVKLMAEKQILYLGDDAYGAYASFRAAEESRNKKIYASLKLLSNMWWLLAWLVVGAAVVRGVRLGRSAVLLWGWLYLFTLHSVFESAGKYHLPMLWVLCICVGVVLSAPPSRGLNKRGSYEPIPA